MTTNDVETGHITGVKDKDYNLLWLVQTYLKNVLRLEGFKRDAERAGDAELAAFLGRAQDESRSAAAEGLELMRTRFLAS